MELRARYNPLQHAAVVALVVVLQALGTGSISQEPPNLQGSLPDRRLLAIEHTWTPYELTPGVRCLDGEQSYGRVCEVQRFAWAPKLATHYADVEGFFAVPDGTPLPEVQNPVSWNCATQNFSINPMPESQWQKLCANAKRISIPLVFISRDYSNLWHYLSAQALPYFVAMTVFDMIKEPEVQMLFFGHHWWHPNTATPEDTFYPDINLLTNTNGTDIDQLPEVVCAERAIVGLSACHQLLYTHQRNASQQEVEHHRPNLAAFRTFLMSKYGLKHAAAFDGKARPKLTLINRRSGKRRVVNIQEMTHWATNKGFDVTVVDFAGLTLRQQLNLVVQSDVLMGAHGAGMSHLLFLPPWGVSVEIMPYKFGPRGPVNQFYFGYAMWARVARRSHIVWHNRSGFDSFKPFQSAIDFFKDHNTRVNLDDLKLILNRTMDALHVPVGQRSLDGDVDRLNEPVEPLTGKDWYLASSKEDLCNA